MSEYSKALLSQDGDYQDREVQGERTVAVARLFVLVDAAISLAVLSLSLPFSLPLWPLVGVIFLSALYAFRRSNPTALRPMLILLMFALTMLPTLSVVLLVSCLREPARTVHVLSALLPFVPPHSSPFFVLLPANFVLLCSVLCLLSWQLHTLRRCQEQFKLGWDSSTVKGYAELYVPDPFLRCEKQPLKHQQRKKEAQKVAADEKAPSNSARVTLKKVLPDYQVFTLNEDEPNVKQRDGGIEGESQQQKRQEYGKNSRSRVSG